MKRTGRLKEAVQLVMRAGYQLDEEAFEFLGLLSTSEDPCGLVERALQSIDLLEEKPFFINRKILEGQVKLAEENDTLSIKSSHHEYENSERAQLKESKRTFCSLAKEVEPEVSIIEDPSRKLCSNGEIEDYLGYFQDRFRRTEKLLRQRIDARSATSVMDAFKAPANTKLKIIGMITSKREANRKIFLSVEDLDASVTVLVPENCSQSLMNKANHILLDQVVCLSVVKTRSNLLIVEDIILPEVAKKKQTRSAIPINAVLTSDMHVGSTRFQKKAFSRFILWLNGKVGDSNLREAASRVKYVLIAGDIVDGVGIYPNQIKELAIEDVHDQYRLAANFIEQIPDYIEVVIIPGNHDATRKALPQPAIPDEFMESLRDTRDVYSLGNLCYLRIHGVEVLLHHGRSLDDIISTVPGMSHHSPERAMTLLLQSRHLAPMYGGKTPISAEKRDFLVIDHVPDVYHSGHIHRIGLSNYRGIVVVNSGCWQEQTDYMNSHGVVPTPGHVPVLDLHTLDVSSISFN